MGGSADLTGSNLTLVKGMGSICAGNEEIQRQLLERLRAAK